MGKKYILTLIFAFVGITQMWGFSSKSYYAQGVAKVSSNSPSGSGTVYVQHVAKGAAKPSDPADTDYLTIKEDKSVDASGVTYDYYFYAKAADGYNFIGWSETDESTEKLDNANPLKIQITAPTSNGTKTETRYAVFAEKKVITISLVVPENGTYTVNGETVNEAKDIQTSEKITLAASPAANYKFLGWYKISNGEKTYFSYDTSTEIAFDADVSIGAEFVPENAAVFNVNGSNFTDLNAADTYATSNGGIIVLASDGTLPSGNYTISSGNTLLIPFDDANTLVTSSGQATTSYSKPSAYRTLTLADGANITVDGNISVSAQIHAGNGGAGNNGSVTGKYGYIIANEGSSITLNYGANLYCWGYITGKGSITAEAGSTVYEDFQFNDFRGGTALSSMSGNDEKVFPINIYFVQNIECPLTLKYGSNEKVTTYINASIIGTQSATIDYIGSNGLFKLTSGGSLTKEYDPTNDKQLYKTKGSVSIDQISLSVAGYSFSSSDYVLPLTYNFSVTAETGTLSLLNDAALLPGSEVIVNKGATLSIDSGQSLYVYDSDAEDWSSSYIYPATNSLQVHYSPTKTGTRSATSLADAKLDVQGTVISNGYIYTTSAGANICSSGNGSIKFTNGPGSATTTYQAVQSGSNVSYPEIAITPAWLKNDTETYPSCPYSLTSGLSAGSTEYYRKGMWCSEDYAVFAGNSTKQDMNSDALENARTTAPNLVAISFTEEGGQNILTLDDGSREFTCSDFVLTDKQNFYSPVNFTASTASYTRDMGTSKLGTICLPYVIDLNGIDLYEFDSKVEADGTVILKFNKVTEPKANTPYLFKMKDGGEFEDQSDVTVESSVDKSLTSEAGGWTMQGVYERTSVCATEDKMNSLTSITNTKIVDANSYYTKSDHFCKVNGYFNLSAFRAYLSAPSSGNAKELSVSFNDDVVDALEAITSADEEIVAYYDANGVIQNGLKDGLNIIKYKNGKTVKVIIK